MSHSDTGQLKQLPRTSWKMSLAGESYLTITLYVNKAISWKQGDSWSQWAYLLKLFFLVCDKVRATKDMI